MFENGKIVQLDENKLSSPLDMFSMILFDCKNPKYLLPRINKDGILEKPLIKNLTGEEFINSMRKQAFCDEKKDQIWFRKKSSKEKHSENTYVTVRVVYQFFSDKRLISLNFLDMSRFKKMLNNNKFCQKFMKFKFHPYYYKVVKAFNFKSVYFEKPIEC